MSNPNRLVAAFIQIATAALGVAISHADQLLPVTFVNSRDGFSISFPAGWAQMPPGQLESANRAAQAQLPGAKRPLVHYGYEMTNSAGFPFSPYVIIRVAETGRTPDAKTIEDDMTRGDELPQGVQREKPIFDRELNAFLQSFRATITGAPPVDASVAYFLTKTSVIKMFFYVPAVDDPGIAVPVQQIIRNVQVHQGAKLSGSRPTSRMGLIIALLAIIAIVLVLARAKPPKCA